MKQYAKVIVAALLIAFLGGASWYWFAGRTQLPSVSSQRVQTSLEPAPGHAGGMERSQSSAGGKVHAADGPTNQATVSPRSLQASLEHALDAGRARDVERVRQSTGWIVEADVPSATKEEIQEMMTGHFVRTASQASRMRVVNQLQESAEVVRVRIERTAASGAVTQSELRFVREAGEWKPAFKVSRSPSGGYGATFLLEPTAALEPTNRTTHPR